MMNPQNLTHNLKKRGNKFPARNNQFAVHLHGARKFSKTNGVVTEKLQSMMAKNKSKIASPTDKVLVSELIIYTDL
jgi:hypothetical protein